MSTFYKDVITQAMTTANAIGMTLNRSAPKSHDPFEGFDYRELLDLVGEGELEKLRKEYNEKTMKEIEAHFKEGDKLNMGSPVLSKRGKTKGLNGWVVNEMPSQYNDNETAYLVNDLQGKGGWVNGKSLTFRVPQIGEEDVFKGLVSKREKWASEVKRGTRVRCVDTDITGVLLGFGKIGFCVAVQWEGMQAEEWVSVGRLETVA
tara:strand:+ start:860 stop:1474 length:615 start_codon:yes stop_codon:yes gene_type:complete